jgi:formate hydrogenlyase subunit 3/multisubunit Na+/H+ antiporter MnhD subunit
MLLFFIGFVQNWFGLSEFLVNTQIYKSYLDFLIWQRIEIFIIILIPFISAIFELFFGDKLVNYRDKMLVYSGFVVIFLLIMIYPKVLLGEIDYKFPNLLFLGISFKIDFLAYTILLISAYVWFYVIVYAHEYMTKEKHSTRFFFFLALTYSSVIGTIASFDLLTMFLFFEVMTLASYMLVIHGQTDESYRAGFNYIVMGLIGGFLIFTALVLVYFHVGSLEFVSIIEVINDNVVLKYWILVLLVLGFGIKAGMAPVHVWLPRAHPVAPTPASALLSGVMIKVGAYGIIRVASTYFFPAAEVSIGIDNPLWNTASIVGALIIWIGIFTMLLGVVLALQQANIKKLLAYSSISQMGYILVGIGVALYLGYEGAMGYTGAVYHIINHALFKSLLFMVAGVIYFHTKELDMYKLGGLWKKLPLTSLLFLIGMFGIIGMPLFNGYVSKTILHHGIVEAYQYGSQIFILAEILFIIASIGTVCYFSKMFYHVFLRKTENAYKSMTFDFSSLDLALVGVGIIIVSIGLFPRFIVNALILPQMQTMSFSQSFIEYKIMDINLFPAYDLLMAIGVIVLGILAFIFGRKYRLFQIKLPYWISIEYWFFLPAFLVMRNLCKILYGDKCPYNEADFAKLSTKDVENIGFIERFVITTNVLNRRYERSIIKADALIYSLFITVMMVLLFFA